MGKGIDGATVAPKERINIKYEVQKNLMQDIPFSLRLSELEARKASQEPVTAAELKGLENDLKALNIRLYQLQQSSAGS
ncbi:hypothetical protein ONZ60_12610 [Aeromonas salmonicida]|nr:VasL domain-containing protein [Aeromonas salmonicida]ORJ13660.1 hypothetical protein A7D02_22090 [Aeromonas salmonicida]ORJ14809.1 hypothetical protein A7D03_04435 [Aeromonas salmonicida]WCH29799.1 hypothetical protein ONZ67_12500 [Aeromonas salmonicida]WCH33994.1 hypothetical protein ONZ60_12610 [Aeromonas salmonicida]